MQISDPLNQNLQGADLEVYIMTNSPEWLLRKPIYKSISKLALRHKIQFIGSHFSHIIGKILRPNLTLIWKYSILSEGPSMDIETSSDGRCGICAFPVKS